MGPDEFIQVTAADVRRLGSANAALVWCRIEFVCRVGGWDRVEDEDGALWWVVSKPRLSQDIGLSERTIRTTLQNLIDKGHIESKLIDDSAWDRSLAYRAVGDVSAGHAHRTKKSDASDEKVRCAPPAKTDDNRRSAPSDEKVRCIGRKSPIDQTKKSDVPYIEEVKKKKVIKDDPTSDDLTFDEWWKHYPRKVKKIEARKAYAKALKLTDAQTLLSACMSFAKQIAGKDTEWIPHPTSWLNQGRWEDDGVKPVSEDEQLDWLRERWKAADVKSVEEASGLSFRMPDESPGDDEDITEFNRRIRQQWIEDHHDEIIHRIMARKGHAA